MRFYIWSSSCLIWPLLRIFHKGLYLMVLGMFQRSPTSLDLTDVPAVASVVVEAAPIMMKKDESVQVVTQEITNTSMQTSVFRHGLRREASQEIISVLEKFSMVTKFARDTTANLFGEKRFPGNSEMNLDQAPVRSAYLAIHYAHSYSVFFWLPVFLIARLPRFSTRSASYCYFAVYCGLSERVHADDSPDRLRDESAVSGSTGALLSNDRVRSSGRDGEEETAKIISEVVHVLARFFWKKASL